MKNRVALILLISGTAFGAVRPSCDIYLPYGTPDVVISILTKKGYVAHPDPRTPDERRDREMKDFLKPNDLYLVLNWDWKVGFSKNFISYNIATHILQKIETGGSGLIGYVDGKLVNGSTFCFSPESVFPKLLPRAMRNVPECVVR